MADNDGRYQYYTGDDYVYVSVRRIDFDVLARALDEYPHNVEAHARILVNHARLLDDAAVDSAGDRMLGPDNPVRPMPATDNDDSELWKLLAGALHRLGPVTTAAVRDAIAARYGNT